MTSPKPGEVYWVDLGYSGKVRPLMVVSREDPSATRALAVCVPLTTQIKSGPYEVPVPRLRWMPGSDPGVANLQGITPIEFHRLTQKAGRFDSAVLQQVRKGLAWMLEI